ncbi:MAG TPA: phospholipase D-like domain-containing protein, partial [Caldimonas sp.]|nr:phospholipase D-like domain-containing protein [Caldimonas sp.]
AGKSIDAQYYLIQNDDLGQQFLRELRDAARRGVRVRLLVDDLYAAGEDDLLSGLAAYTNVDVRIFNPLPARAGPFYFIPGERGMAIIRAVGATQENGRLALVTASLGLTDEPLVYAGYARYRVDLLKAGVRIYEIGATLGHDSDRLGHFGASIGRLHAKVATIDRRWLFIGSMNLDPRSAQENTEIGLAIDSPDLAETILMLFQEGLDATYRLRLSADGEHVEWLETDAVGWQHVHTREPDEDALLRLKIWLLAPFVGEGLL